MKVAIDQIPTFHAEHIFAALESVKRKNFTFFAISVGSNKNEPVHAIIAICYCLKRSTELFQIGEESFASTVFGAI